MQCSILILPCVLRRIVAHRRLDWEMIIFECGWCVLCYLTRCSDGRDETLPCFLLQYCKKLYFLSLLCLQALVVVELGQAWSLSQPWPHCAVALLGNRLHLLLAHLRSTIWHAGHGHEAWVYLFPLPFSSCLSVGLRRNVTQCLLPLLYMKGQSLATGFLYILVAKWSHILALVESLSLYAQPRIAWDYFDWSNCTVWKSTHLPSLTPRSLLASLYLSSTNYSCCWCAAYICLSAYPCINLTIKKFFNIIVWYQSLDMKWSINFCNLESVYSFNSLFEWCHPHKHCSLLQDPWLFLSY